jgi:hypothetical protein
MASIVLTGYEHVHPFNEMDIKHAVASQPVVLALDRQWLDQFSAITEEEFVRWVASCYNPEYEHA